MKRVFLDENVDPKLKAVLTDFQVSSVQDEFWNSAANGELIRLIESRFDVLLSHDQGIEFQQRWTNRDLALIVMKTPSNRFETYSARIDILKELILKIKPSEVIRFEAN